MITTKTMVDWLESLGLIGVKFGIGPNLPDKPDRFAAVTRGPGRVEHEGALDRATFTVRLRGPMHDLEQAEIDIELLRRLVEANQAPESTGISACWVDGPATPIPGTPDSGRRSEFVATFVALTV